MFCPKAEFILQQKDFALFPVEDSGQEFLLFPGGVASLKFLIQGFISPTEAFCLRFLISPADLPYGNFLVKNFYALRRAYLLKVLIQEFSLSPVEFDHG